MWDLLAQNSGTGIAETIGAVVGAAVLVLGGREGIDAVKRKRANGSAYNKALCDERHKTINRELTGIQGKLDRVLEHLIGKN